MKELEQLREELGLLSNNAKAERAALDIVFGEVFAVMAPTKDGRTRNDWREPEDRGTATSDHIMAARRHINKGITAIYGAKVWSWINERIV